MARVGSVRKGVCGGTPSTAEVVVVGSRYASLLSIGTWLQATGALLCVVFFLGLTHLCGAASSLAGRVVLLGSAVLVALVLAEGVFTLTWVSAALGGEAASARASYDLMSRFIQVFPIVPAPAVYLPLAVSLGGAHVLSPWFARTAAVLGVGFVLLGLAGVLTPLAQAGTGGWSALQDLWILAAAITLLARGDRAVPGEG